MLLASSLIPDVWWDPQLARWAVWGGLVLLTIALLLLVRTRWGQQPLSKCVVLSLLAHVLLGIYMTTVQIVGAPAEGPEPEGVQVSIVDGAAEMVDDATEPSDAERGSAKWDAITGEEPPPLEVPDLGELAEPPPLEPIAEPKRDTPQDDTAPLAALPELPATEEAPPEFLARNEPLVRPVTSRAEASELPSDDGDVPPLVPPPERPAEPDPAAKPTEQPAAEPATASGELNGNRPPAAAPLPKVLQGRAGDHLRGGRGDGATPETEAAVAAALRWLTTNQSPNGRWDPRRLDAGIGLAADGENRNFAGAHADTGLTGLALLALLASGHTHLAGDYRDHVRRGLEFLLTSQDATGNLGATNNVYERMYCHAMATCALSEAYAMTRDKRLLAPLQSAINFTIRTQDRPSGSWRYLVGQPGDTSQLGWQVMALKSAELGGIPTPRETRTGIERFLRSVASGTHNGLACYQPTRPLPTRSMTAEAMACREFLGIAVLAETNREASDYILQDLPGAGVTNHYYWYYATLALHQAQGEPWRRWNAALQKKLLETQRHDGSWTGSWDPDPVWGRCGGRVYSTALCTLCLEVYYRYLPLYETARAADGQRQ